MAERGYLTAAHNCIQSGYKDDEAKVLVMADDKT